MGALTLKPVSFQSRPWEVTRVAVENHLEELPLAQLVFSFRGTKVVQVHTATGWLTDRVRFSYDSFRRQRLITPLFQGQPTTWLSALTRWLTTVNGGRPRYFLDSTARYFGWWVRAYNLLKDLRGVPMAISYNSPVAATVYHGTYGLPSCHYVYLTLPNQLSYEENGTLVFPGTVPSSFLFSSLFLQLFKGQPTAYRLTSLEGTADSYPRRRQHTFFQVSPLQTLLTSEW